jgi:ferritin
MSAVISTFLFFLLVDQSMSFISQSQRTARLASVAAFATRAPVTTRGRVASNELLELFSKQVTNELQASQLYLSASVWCSIHDLDGMAAFMRGESEDERRHGLAFIDFANKRNIPIKLSALEAPAADWKSPQDLWGEVLASEVRNTQALFTLGDAAASCSDHAVTTFLMPYHMVSPRKPG